MLGPNLFKGPVRMPGLPADFPPAMDFAVAQGWVEKLDPDQYRLTDTGFAVTQSDAKG
ncbi:MAG TPA: hypothetical protein VHT28_18650 [Silvibacterium sp.]|jgi:hypothetical protein|nr:hypothetical protein [Silvibacterium sp.]